MQERSKKIQGFVRSKLNFRERLRKKIRDKAISRAQTRIILAGKRPEEFELDMLEVIVKEEEDNIKQNIREKGLLAIALALGLGWL